MIAAAYPKMTCVDPGSDFVSRGLELWAYIHNVILDFSRPGNDPKTLTSDEGTLGLKPQWDERYIRSGTR